MTKESTGLGKTVGEMTGERTGRMSSTLACLGRTVGERTAERTVVRTASLKVDGPNWRQEVGWYLGQYYVINGIEGVGLRTSRRSADGAEECGQGIPIPGFPGFDRT